MAAPLRPWETQSTGILRSSNPNPFIPQASTSGRSVPALPPRPSTLASSTYGSMNNSYMPYSGMGYNSYSSMPYRSSMYNSYGGYGYNSGSMYGMGGYPGYGVGNDAENRFIQFAEDNSRNTFANIENVIRAFSSIAAMLDNTFFAMTSSFRAVLSVAENFGRLRSIFGQIWYSINIFRLFKWFYRKLLWFMGYKIPETAGIAWDEAAGAALPEAPSVGSNWPTLAFFGVLITAPYFISKLLPKYEDKSVPEKWKSPGVRAKAAFDFVATSSNELSLQMNDEITLAPKYIQDEMKLTNTGWAFAVFNSRSGVVPLNYLVIIKKVNPKAQIYGQEVPIPRLPVNNTNSIEKKVRFEEEPSLRNVDTSIKVAEEKSADGKVSIGLNDLDETSKK